MKHRVFSGVALVVVIGMASVAFAGEYHAGTTLQCSDCHVMHFSQQHDYDFDTNPFDDMTGETGPNAYLLRDDASSLCLSCHDGVSGIPDVLHANTNTYERQAGALNELGDGTAVGAGYGEWDGHTLGYTGTIPGNASPTGIAELTCISCHSAHGSGAALGSAGYRNLGGYGTGWDGTNSLSQISYNVAGTTTEWITLDTGNGGSLADQYGQDRVTFNRPFTAAGNGSYGDFCAGCHGDFHGDPAGTNIGGTVASGGFERHPVIGVDIGGIGGGHSNDTQFASQLAQLHVLSNAGAKAGTYADTDALTPSCMTCHKGHGNQNTFGLIYVDGTEAHSTLTEEGTPAGTYRNMCKQCHVQGG